MLGDQDLLATLYPLEERGQVRLGFEGTDSQHLMIHINLFFQLVYHSGWICQTDDRDAYGCAT